MLLDTDGFTGDRAYDRGGRAARLVPLYALSFGADDDARPLLQAVQALLALLPA